MEELIQKALNILKKRENYYGEHSRDSESYAVQCSNLDRACAYNTAWWILYYAINGNEEALNQFDYLE